MLLEVADLGWSAAFDGDLEAVWLPLDQLDVSVVEPADADDAVEVVDVAVVEDEAARRGVVADVVDVRVVAGVGLGG